MDTHFASFKKTRAIWSFINLNINQYLNTAMREKKCLKYIK